MINMKKLYISILVSILYVLLSLPCAYSFTDKLLKSSYIRTTFDNCPGLPTVSGSIIHGIFFMGITYIVLIFKEKEVPRIKIEKIKNAERDTIILNSNE